MSSIAFGRYTPYSTFTHRLDPRSKIFMLILLLVTIFLQLTVWSTTLIVSGILFIFLIVLMIISKVNFLDFLKSMKMLWFLVLFLLIIYVLIPNAKYNPDHVLFHIGRLAINYDAFYQCGYIILRIVEMLMITMILTSTTTPMNLTYGLEWYMTPLKLVKFPTHIVAMTLSIALRFIPTLLDEVDRIIKAQSSRGVDFEHGGFFKRFGAIISLIIPLFVSAINRSEELSNAMEARGYDPYGKRTKYRVLKFSWRDLIATLLVVAIFAGIIVMKVYDKRVENINLILWIFGVNPPF